MRWLIALCCLFLMGCDENFKLKQPPPPPLPKIEVEQTESMENNYMVINYLDHHIIESKIIVEIKDRDQLKHYKSQVEFLLKRLIEAEDKMAANEDKPNEQNTKTKVIP